MDRQVNNAKLLQVAPAKALINMAKRLLFKVMQLDAIALEARHRWMQEGRRAVFSANYKEVQGWEKAAGALVMADFSDEEDEIEEMGRVEAVEVVSVVAANNGEEARAEEEDKECERMVDML